MKFISRKLLKTYLYFAGGLIANLILLIPSAQSTDFMVTSVIREVTLKQGDPNFKDFYINAGMNNGLKSGVYIDAKRKINAYDNMNSKMIGDTPIKVARLKLIHVDKNISVARLVKLYEKETTPISGYDSVMVGDTIEVSQDQ